MPDPPAKTPDRPVDKALERLVDRAGILGMDPDTPAGREVQRMFAAWYQTAPAEIPEPLKQFAAERATECELLARSNFRTLMSLRSPRVPKRIPDVMKVAMDEEGNDLELDVLAMARMEKKARLDAQAHNAAYNAAMTAYRNTVTNMRDAVALMGLTRLLNPGKEKDKDSPDFERTIKEMQKRLGIKPSETVDAEFSEEEKSDPS